MTKSSKEVATIDQLLVDPWAVDTQGTWEQATHSPDPDKRKLFDALHTYVLDKRREGIINEKHFVIYHGRVKESVIEMKRRHKIRLRYRHI